jgi:cis-3-alkyl-4-acyloxetan-2-one decarboxylase
VPAADWRPLYPFASHYLSLDGQRLHYVDEGAGQTLLLVHGNPTWSFHWRELIRQWRDRYRVIAIDHVGCGLSDKPREYNYRLAQHVENLKRLIVELDLNQITLLAQDWGGAIGLGAAGEMPQRFRRLILFNTAAFRSSWAPLRIRVCRTPVVGRAAVQGGNLFLEAALRMAFEHPEWLTPEVRAGYRAPYDTWAHREAIYRFVEDIPLSPRHPSYAVLKCIESYLGLLRDKPVQLQWGLRDWCFTPWFLERFLEFFPAADVVRHAEAGHWVVEDAREQVITEVERFLNAHPL